MKKFIFLALTTCLSLVAFSPSDVSEDAASPGFSSSPFSGSRRAPYCNNCRRYHYGGCPTTPPPPPTSAPIDGGLSILLAAGAAYGIKRRARNERK